jgi:hypothetical protein
MGKAGLTSNFEQKLVSLIYTGLSVNLDKTSLKGVDIPFILPTLKPYLKFPKKIISFVTQLVKFFPIINR